MGDRAGADPAEAGRRGAVVAPLAVVGGRAVRRLRTREENARELVGAATGLALWAGPAVVAVTTVVVLAGAGAHLLAALAFALALGALAAVAVMGLLPFLRD